MEKIDLDDVKTEKILLGFRSLNGVEMSLFNEEEMKKILAEKKKQRDKLKRRK